MLKAAMYNPAHHNHIQLNPPPLQSVESQDSERFRKGRKGIFLQVRKTTSIRPFCPHHSGKPRVMCKKDRQKKLLRILTQGFQSRRERAPGVGKSGCFLTAPSP